MTSALKVGPLWELLAMAASTTTGRLQGGCHGVSCITLSSATLSEPASSRLLPTRSPPTSFFIVTAAAVGWRSFPVAASLLWNSLPTDIQSSPSLPVSRQRLKTFLFRQSFPDLAHSANLPEGLYILLALISSFFSMSKAISVSTAPIFTIFSPNERYLREFSWSGPVF